MRGSRFHVPCTDTRCLDTHVLHAFRQYRGVVGRTVTLVSPGNAMHYGLMFRLAGSYAERAVGAMKRLIADVQDEGFLLGPPQLVDVVDRSGRTHPDDQPIRAVGGYLIMHPPTGDMDRELEAAPLRDVERLVEGLARLTLTESICVELELDGEEVGAIQRGVVSEGISRGLVGEWKRRVGSARKEWRSARMGSMCSVARARPPSRPGWEWDASRLRAQDRWGTISFARSSARLTVRCASTIRSSCNRWD